MTNVYLELDERQAQFFEYSKEPKEGFEKNESSNGKVSYRKYYKEGVKGVLKFINERNEEFPTGTVKKMSIAVDNGDNRYYMKMNILNQNKSMNQFVEQLIPILPNVTVGETYRFFPYEMETTYTNRDGVEKTGKNKGISVATWDLDNDVKLLKVDKAHSFAKDGDIPQIKWTPEEDMDGVIKNVKDDKDRRNFLYKIFKSCITESNTSAQAPAAQKPAETTAPKAKTEQPALEEEDHDDLPF